MQVTLEELAQEDQSRSSMRYSTKSRRQGRRGRNGWIQ